MHLICASLFVQSHFRDMTAGLVSHSVLGALSGGPCLEQTEVLVSFQLGSLVFCSAA